MLALNTGFDPVTVAAAVTQASGPIVATVLPTKSVAAPPPPAEPEVTSGEGGDVGPGGM